MTRSSRLVGLNINKENAILNNIVSDYTFTAHKINEKSNYTFVAHKINEKSN